MKELNYNFCFSIKLSLNWSVLLVFISYGVLLKLDKRTETLDQTESLNTQQLLCEMLVGMLAGLCDSREKS
jgi:flagellar biosynthesis protein FliR